MLVAEDVEVGLFVCVLHDGEENRERGLTDYNYNLTLNIKMMHERNKFGYTVRLILEG